MLTKAARGWHWTRVGIGVDPRKAASASAQAKRFRINVRDGQELRDYPPTARS